MGWGAKRVGPTGAKRPQAAGIVSENPPPKVSITGWAESSYMDVCKLENVPERRGFFRHDCKRRENEGRMGAERVGRNGGRRSPGSSRPTSWRIAQFRPHSENS